MLSFMTPGGGRTCLMAGVAKKYADGVPHLVIFVHASQHGYTVGCLKLTQIRSRLIRGLFRSPSLSLLAPGGDRGRAAHAAYTASLPPFPRGECRLEISDRYVWTRDVWMRPCGVLRSSLPNYVC